MRTTQRMAGTACALALALGAVALGAQTAQRNGGPPKLAISPFGYRVTQIQTVPDNPRAFDIISMAGVCGDAATAVSAHLTSSSPRLVVLDGQVDFGNVPRASCVRPVSSRNTFTLRVILPRSSQLTWELIRDLLHSLSWRLTCDACSANRPPAANAGADQTSHVGQLVTLDGTASTDPDGVPLTYQWTIVDRPLGSAAALAGASTVHPTFTPDRAGDYLVQLVVGDGQLVSAPDAVRISTLNSQPVANAGPDQTVYVGQPVALDGTRSTDVDGDSLAYSWSLVSRPAGSAAELTSPSQSTAGFTADVPGDYAVHLVVNDGDSASAPDVVMVSTLNSPPVANAGPDQTGFVTQSVQLDGSGSSDADGDRLRFRWSLSSMPPGSLASLDDPSGVRPAFVIDRPGTYVAQLIVNDGVADSEADTLVVSTLNSAPRADAGPSQNVHWNAVVFFDGGASTDADGDVLGYAWSILSRPEGSRALLEGAGTARPSFRADRLGIYVIQLIVNDGTIDSAPATVAITATNQPPVASDDSARTTEGAAVDVDVLANDSDADGDALQLISVSTSARGTTAIVSGRVRYTPSTGFSGTDSFSYTVTDGADSATGIVTVLVGATPPPPPGPVARLELGPSAVLLTTVDQLWGLEVRAFDAAGAPTFVLGDELEYVSSNEEEIRVFGDTVQALVIPGSALVRVRLIADPSIVSPPVMVTAASVRADVVVISDGEIVDEPVPVDVADRRYQVRLDRALEVGALILNSGGKPVMGRVVSVDPDAGDGTFRTEVRLVPLTAIFFALNLSYSFTSDELSGLIREDDAPALAALKHDTTILPNLRALTADSLAPMNRTLSAISPAAADAQANSRACTLEFNSTELTGDITGNVTPTLGFDLDLVISDGSLERFKVIASGSVAASLNLTASIGAAVELEGSCKKKLATIFVPIGGPLSLLIGGRVPIGFKGSLGLLVQHNLANITVAQDLQADMVLGVHYERGQGFLPVDMLSVVATPATTTIDIPPSSLRFRGKAFLGGTAGITLGVLGEGFPLFELADLSGGPQFEARFGEPYDVLTDTAYTAGYELKMVGKAGPGADITEAFEEIFGAVLPPFDLTLQFEDVWGTSPSAGVVLKADRAAFTAGDEVTFQVDLAPGSASFPFLGYNVSEVRVYFRDEASSTAQLVASAPGIPGTTSFELPWTADRDGRTTDPRSGLDNFFAFVVPDLLSTPSATYPLELGPVRGVAPIEIIPREVILGTGGTQQFRARTNGDDTTAVNWTTTGGTISSTGFFQAGNTPGTYKVTVARADAPSVTDEATVELRPRCVPGTNAYCGFSYAPKIWPSNTTWDATAVNDNGDWVALLYDAPQVRDAGLRPLVFFGRGNDFQLVQGLNDPTILSLTFREGGFQTQILKLTNTNAFAGSYVRGALNGHYGAFVSQGGVTRFLDPLPGDSDAQAYDVNDDLVVVGWSGSPDPSTRRAVRWINGVAEDLGFGPGSLAHSISADGRILVTDGFDALRTPAVWQNGVVTTLPGSTGCLGLDINSSGDVVASGCTEVGGFVWRNGVRESLEGSPYAINDNGDILGYASQSGAIVGVLWQNGVRNVLDFGPFIDGPSRAVKSISRTKSLLGGNSIQCTGNDCRSFVWLGYPIALVVP